MLRGRREACEIGLLEPHDSDQYVVGRTEPPRRTAWDLPEPNLCRCARERDELAEPFDAPIDVPALAISRRGGRPSMAAWTARRSDGE